MVQYGPPRTRVRSTTRSPASAPGDVRASVASIAFAIVVHGLVSSPVLDAVPGRLQSSAAASARDCPPRRVTSRPPRRAAGPRRGRRIPDRSRPSRRSTGPRSSASSASVGSGVARDVAIHVEGEAGRRADGLHRLARDAGCPARSARGRGGSGTRICRSPAPAPCRGGTRRAGDTPGAEMLSTFSTSTRGECSSRNRMVRGVMKYMKAEPKLPGKAHAACPAIRRCRRG